MYIQTYLREKGRDDMCSMHVQQLSDMHRSLGNHIEAAFTLTSAAQNIPWGRQRVYNSDNAGLSS